MLPCMRLHSGDDKLDSAKHASILQYSKNYGRKKFCSAEVPSVNIEMQFWAKKMRFEMKICHCKNLSTAFRQLHIFLPENIWPTDI